MPVNTRKITNVKKGDSRNVDGDVPATYAVTGMS